MLGLVAMATTVDNLYASMKALVCIIGDNQVALKEMERTGGFQVDTCTCTRTIIIHTVLALIIRTAKKNY
jgi:hypothetical protein